MNEPGASDERQVDYEQMVASYQASLTTMLRGFRGGARFLAGWVHDEDDAKSILAMIEAAAAEGLPDVTIAIGTATRGRLDVARLETLASSLGTVQRLPRADGFALRVAFASRDTDRSGSAAVAYQRARRAREDRDARLRDRDKVATTSSRNAVETSSSVYRAAIERILSAPLVHEGTLEERAGLVLLRAVESGVALAALVDPATHVVRDTRHEGRGDDRLRALLEGVCGLLEGRPLLEGSDHAVIRLEHSLRDRSRPRPVAGIVTPESAEPTFRLLGALVRALLHEYRARMGFVAVENRFDPDPGSAWRALSHGQRLGRIQEVLDRVAPRHGLRSGDVKCTKLDRITRVTIEVLAAVPTGHKPSLLMHLEADLKAEIDPTLHLYQEEMADKNKIRRI